MNAAKILGTWLAAAPVLANAATFQSTPVMGWNSYNAMGCTPNEQGIIDTINALSSNGFVNAGYKFFQIDCGWAAHDLERNSSSGAIKIDYNQFPNGLEPLSDLVRSKGMKWSMYSDAGVRMCDPENPDRVLGSLGHERADAELFKRLNTEYLKYDNCYIDGAEPWRSSPKDPRSDYPQRFGTMWNELQRVGIPGFLVCQWGSPYSTDQGLKGPASWTKGISTSFRISDDIAPGWHNVLRIYNQMIHIARSGAVGPHNIADMDLLEVGNNAGMTFDEQATHFAMWAMFKSALMISTDLKKITFADIAILQNRGLIAINQDPLVQPVKLVQRWTWDRDVLAGNLANGDLAVLVVNQQSVRRDLKLDLSELGLAKADILNLWTGETQPGVSSYSQQVEGHGSLALRLSNTVSSNNNLNYGWITAESGRLESGARQLPCHGCSSSNKVGYLGGDSNGSLTLDNIFTSRETQNVLFDYINCDVVYMNGGFHERLASVSVNGGPPQTISFPLSGYTWESDVYPSYPVQLSGFRTNGPNSITISGYEGNAAPDFVRVGVAA
ncbi:hypothetical protein NLG97_g1875 [Lecanicillium saksenae]|uniref:Uncharacterized protein n=1 Tax=Lecanicillium saksenae TaxID=468837 RepID=A0ACC1R4E7_9HYPO|nr:hypothetical protein NLG97_g1875 [Lecanicillium saksenae]